MMTMNDWTGASWPQRFEGANALVFGGASGIGAATVDRLRTEGARVLVADRNRPKGAPDEEFIDCDLLDDGASASTVAQSIKRLGHLDLVVNTVGIVLDAAVTETTTDDWQRIIAVNLTGAFEVTRATLAALAHRRGSSITHVASDAGLVGWRNQSAYCASKGGLVHFVKAAAIDAATTGVRVNCVCPSFTATPLVEQWIGGTDDPERTRMQIEGTQPLARMARPEEVAAGIAWLASSEAAWVTGIALPIDGGVVAQ